MAPDTKSLNEGTMEVKAEDTTSTVIKPVVTTQEGELENLDEAGLFLQKHNFTTADLSALMSDAEKNRKIIRKIDWILMPLLCGTYFLQYIDKQALSYAAVFDLLKSTKTSSDQYGWLVSIFYFAYLVFEWPSSYMVQHFPASRVLGSYVICWGVVLLCTAASHNFTGLAICRFLLGIFESVVTPCFMLVVGMWYVKQEQPIRAGLFYCFNGWGSMAGGILFYAVGHAKGFLIWRIIFLLCGGVTVVWGFVLLYFLPNDIMSAKRFTVDEKALLIARSRQNQTGVLNRKIKWDQVVEALTDPQVWLLFLFVLLNEVVNGGLANFGKLIIKGVAKNNALLTTVYGIPQSAFQVAFVFSGPYLAGKIKNSRTIIMAAYLIPSIIGTAMLWKMPRKNTIGCLFGYYICASYVASLVLALQLPATNVGGYTKRVTSTAFVFLAYCAGNIIGPHSFLANEAPIYPTGCKTALACTALQFAIAIGLRYLLIYRNKKRDEAQAGQNTDLNAQGSVQDLFGDMTDKHNPNFRYAY